jgi:hypothetical protein
MSSPICPCCAPHPCWLGCLQSGSGVLECVNCQAQRVLVVPSPASDGAAPAIGSPLRALGTAATPATTAAAATPITAPTFGVPSTSVPWSSAVSTPGPQAAPPPTPAAASPASGLSAAAVKAWAAFRDAEVSLRAIRRQSLSPQGPQGEATSSDAGSGSAGSAARGVGGLKRPIADDESALVDVTGDGADGEALGAEPGDDGQASAASKRRRGPESMEGTAETPTAGGSGPASGAAPVSTAAAVCGSEDTAAVVPVATLDPLQHHRWFCPWVKAVRGRAAPP